MENFDRNVFNLLKGQNELFSRQTTNQMPITISPDRNPSNFRPLANDVFRARILEVHDSAFYRGILNTITDMLKNLRRNLLI